MTSQKPQRFAQNIRTEKRFPRVNDSNAQLWNELIDLISSKYLVQFIKNIFVSPKQAASSYYSIYVPSGGVIKIIFYSFSALEFQSLNWIRFSQFRST